MKKKGKTVGLALLCALLVFWCQPAFCGTATTDDVLKRLNDLSDIIQQQQNEIERLKQELESQRKSIEKGQAIQKEEIKKAVKAETRESEKSWRDSLPKWVNIRLAPCIYSGLTATHLLREASADGYDLSVHGLTGLRQVFVSSPLTPPWVHGLAQNGAVRHWVIVQDRWETTDVRTSAYNGCSKGLQVVS